MTQVTFSTEWMMRRNRLLAVACDSVIEARGLLDQLDKILQGTVMGELPDVERVIHVCHQLGEAKNMILVSLLESTAVPVEMRNPYPFVGPRTGEKKGEGSANEKQ